MYARHRLPWACSRRGGGVTLTHMIPLRYRRGGVGSLGRARCPLPCAALPRPSLPPPFTVFRQLC